MKKNEKMKKGKKYDPFDVHISDYIRLKSERN
jgi:hypothetical protein